MRFGVSRSRSICGIGQSIAGRRRQVARVGLFDLLARSRNNSADRRNHSSFTLRRRDRQARGRPLRPRGNIRAVSVEIELGGGGHES